MNNTLALKKILELKDNEENRLAEFKNVLYASTVLPKDVCKIAIVGTQSKGKCILINLLVKDNIASNPSIGTPICMALEQKIKNATEKTDFCKNNNVKNVFQRGSFCWSNTQSKIIPEKQSLDQILKLSEKFSGIFMEYPNPNHEIAQKTGLLIPPDILPNNTPEVRKKQILNAVDVADIIFIVATPEELNSGLFDFVYGQNGVIADKPVVLFVIHDKISNFFHYPIDAECKDALELEKANRDSAKGAYDTIQKSYTSDEMSQMLKAGMTKDIQNLLQNLEKLIKNNFKKTKLYNAFYLPTGETPSSQDIIEDQKIISDVKNWQFQRIYSEVVQIASITGDGKTPVIAWEYFFRKSEDICFDTLSPIFQKLKIDLVADYAKGKVFDNVLQAQKEEISTLLRDYSNLYNEDELKKLFCEYRAKTLGFLSQSKDKMTKTKASIAALLKESAYCRICGRIKQQYNLSMPTVEKIVEEAFVLAGTQEDVEKFLQYIREKTSTKQIIENWEKDSPLILEKNGPLAQSQARTSTLKENVLAVLDAWICISELVDRKDEIKFIVTKREEIASFTSQKLFQSKQ